MRLDAGSRRDRFVLGETTPVRLDSVLGQIATTSPSSACAPKNSLRRQVADLGRLVGRFREPVTQRLAAGLGEAVRAPLASGRLLVLVSRPSRRAAPAPRRAASAGTARSSRSTPTRLASCRTTCTARRRRRVRGRDTTSVSTTVTVTAADGTGRTAVSSGPYDRRRLLDGFDDDAVHLRRQDPRCVPGGPADPPSSSSPRCRASRRRSLEFARRVEALGCTVALPHLFGDAGSRSPRPAAHCRRVPYVLSSMVPACISRDFHALATGKTSPVIEWLRALARSLHERVRRPRRRRRRHVLHRRVRAGDDGRRAGARAGAVATVAAVRHRREAASATSACPMTTSPRSSRSARRQDLTVLGLRFTGDVRSARTVRSSARGARRQLRRRRDRLVEGQSARQPERAHSVLTEHLVDEPGHPTRDALEKVLDLFRTRLLQ